MLRQLSWKLALSVGTLSAISLGTLCPSTSAAPPERPTFNHTEDPRPNILPNSLYNHHVPYRLQYNRPTYHVGKALYYVVSPTSQEALSWKENLDACRYEGHNCPPMYKGYYYPKPWEVLNTGPRPNYTIVSAAKPAPVATAPSNQPPQDLKKTEEKKEEKKTEEKKTEEKKDEAEKVDAKKS